MCIGFLFIQTRSLLFYSQDICFCLQGLKKTAEELFCDVYVLNKQQFPSDAFTYRTVPYIVSKLNYSPVV